MTETIFPDSASSIRSEIFNAAKTGVTVFDLSDRTQIEMTGADRVRFLHSFTSNDIKRLRPGKGCETFVTNLKGKVVAHVFVFCSENSIWLDATPGQQAAITNHLGKFVLIDDVQIIPRDSDQGELFVTGPLAAALLQLDATLAVGDHLTRTSDGQDFDIRRVDILGQPGFLLSIPRSRVDAIKRSLCGLGISEGSNAEFEVLRIEAGFPLYGVDITDDNLAQEVARTKQCISFDKGCYLGQETIARLDALGHTNRELRRLHFETSAVPVPGTTVHDATGTTEVGIVTSAACGISDIPGKQTPVVFALGFIKRIACQVDTIVSLKTNGVEISGRVI